MEHAQRIRQEFVYDRRYYVLILILMEHAQRVVRFTPNDTNTVCLNPYFNGTCSKSDKLQFAFETPEDLS